MNMKKLGFVPKTSSRARCFLNFPLGNKKGVHFGIVLLVILLVIVVFGLVFYFSPIGKKQITPIPKPEFGIKDMKLCYSVDENFICDENVDGVFKIGTSFYIYFGINNLETQKVGDGYKIGFIETRDLLDIDGSIIPGEDDVVVLDKVIDAPSKGYYKNNVKNEIVSYPSDNEGIYTAVITVEDKFSGEKDTKEIKFSLVK